MIWLHHVALLLLLFLLVVILLAILLDMLLELVIVILLAILLVLLIFCLRHRLLVGFQLLLEILGHKEPKLKYSNSLLGMQPGFIGEFLAPISLLNKAEIFQPLYGLNSSLVTLRFKEASNLNAPLSFLELLPDQATSQVFLTESTYPDFTRIRDSGNPFLMSLLFLP